MSKGGFKLQFLVDGLLPLKSGREAIKNPSPVRRRWVSGFVSSGVLSAQQFQRPSPYERRHHQRCSVAEAGVFMRGSITGRLHLRQGSVQRRMKISTGITGLKQKGFHGTDACAALSVARLTMI
jgi:hypothetical protein